MSADNGGPAFPNVPEGAGTRWDDWDKGMTVRDYFAGKALQGLLACSYPVSELGYSMKDGLSLMENSACFAYELADAMLKERAK